MSSESLNDKVYQKIKTDIMHLILEPDAAVSVQKLADVYGSSRTPVREAVVRLQQEGLVIIYPQARTNVSPINLNRISEECFIRRSLELAMAENFIKNCSTFIIDTLENINAIMRRAMERRNIAEFLATDSRFHRLLFETAGQYLACDFIESSNTHYDRLRFLAIKHRGVDSEDLAEHRAIVEAARRRDGDGMRETLARHLREGKYQMRELQKAYPAYITR
jgi:DNA-binding GntR family transcriptional regulator